MVESDTPTSGDPAKSREESAEESAEKSAESAISADGLTSADCFLGATAKTTEVAVVEAGDDEDDDGDVEDEDNDEDDDDGSAGDGDGPFMGREIVLILSLSKALIGLGSTYHVTYVDDADDTEDADDADADADDDADAADAAPANGRDLR